MQILYIAIRDKCDFEIMFIVFTHDSSEIIDIRDQTLHARSVYDLQPSLYTSLQKYTA